MSGDRAFVERPDPFEDLVEAQRPEVDPDHDHAEAEPEVTDAVDDERLLRRSRRRRLLVPEADEQVAAQAHQLPAHVEEQEVVGEDQHQHAEHEEVQVGEEAPEAAVAVHVADRVDVDEESDRADDEQQHRGQRVDEEADLDVEVAGRDPLVDGDLVLVAAEDDVGEDDHREDPHHRHEAGRHDPGQVARPRATRRDVPRLTEPVVELRRDDAGGPIGIGEVVGVPTMRARRRLLLLRRDAAEPAVIDRSVVVMRPVVAMRFPVVMVAVTVDRDAIDARTDEDGKEEAREGQRRNEGDQEVDRHRPIPSGRRIGRPRPSAGCG